LTILTLCLFFSIEAVDAKADTTLYVHVQGTLVNVREGPGNDFPVIMKLGNGTKVTERLRQENWVAVKVSGWDQIGWIHATLLKREKTEDSNDNTSSKEDYSSREVSRSPAASIRSEATQELEKVDISPESVSGKFLYAKIGVVDIQKIIFDSKMGKEARKYIKDLNSLKSEEDLERIREKLMDQMIKDTKVIVKKYATEKGFSLIIRKQALLFSVDVRFDITDDIIRIYDERVEVSASSEQKTSLATPQESKPQTLIHLNPEAEIRQLLSDWKTAWQLSAGLKGDIKKYLSFYSENFITGIFDKNSWGEKKTIRNQKTAWIEIDISDITVDIANDGNSAEVRFSQQYNSPNYSDISQKILFWVKEDSSWRIVSEKSDK